MRCITIQIKYLLLILFTGLLFRNLTAEEIAERSWDVILLKNGDRISGNIINKTTESLTVHTASFGNVTIPATEVADLKLGTQEHKAVGPSAAVSIPSPSPSPSMSVQISLNAPETIVVGTQNQNTFGGTLRILSNLPDLCAASNWSTALLLSANHDRKWKVKSAPNVTDTFDGTVSLNNKAFGRTDWYLVGDFFGNSSIGVGLQQGYGGGLSTLLYSTDCPGGSPNYRLTVTGDVGLRYIWQRLYAPGIKANFAGVRPSLGISYSNLANGSSGVKTERFSTNLSLWVMPMVNEIQATQAGGAFQFTVPLNKRLSIALVQEDDFVNNAPKLRRKNYLKTGATVTYTFPPPPAK